MTPAADAPARRSRSNPAGRMGAGLRRIADFLSLGLLRKIAIRHRLVIAFIALALLPLLVSGMLSYAESSRAIEAKTRLFFVEIVKQVAQNLQLQMSQLEGASEGFALSDRVQSSLRDYYGADQAAHVRARSALTRNLLETYGSFDYINQKYILDNDSRLMDAQVFSQLGDSVARLARDAAPGTQATWTTYRSSAGQKSLAMVRRILSKADNVPVGTLFIGIRPRLFSATFDNVQLGDHASLFILDLKDGSAIVEGRNGAGVLSNGVADPALVQAIAIQAAAGRQSDFVEFNGGGQAYRAAFTHIAHSSWYVVHAASLQSLLAEPQAIRDKLMLIGLACAAVAVLLSLLISRSISTPLDRLVAIMQQTESGDYRSRVPDQGNDEVTVLARKFNDMARRVHEHNERLEERVAERTRDLAQATRSLEILSATDGLTGIPNRRRFDDVLASELQRAVRSQQPLTLLMLDVDLFKNYNDLYGHQAGDDCLREVANFLQSRSRRSSDLVARYGGEEFAFIGVDTDEVSALELGQSICAALQARALPHAHSPFGAVTVSIGVATLVPTPGFAPEAMIRMADAAMYRAKNEGRNRVCIAPAARTDAGRST